MVTHLYSDTSICTSSLSLSCLILGSGSPSPCLVATLLPVPELPSVRASCLRWLKLTNEKSVFGSRYISNIRCQQIIVHPENLPAGSFPGRGDPEHAVHAELGGDLLWVDAAREGEPLLELLGHVGLARGGLALLLGRHDQHLALGLDVEILTSVNVSYEISVNITV